MMGIKMGINYKKKQKTIIYNALMENTIPVGDTKHLQQNPVNLSALLQILRYPQIPNFEISRIFFDEEFVLLTHVNKCYGNESVMKISGP